MFCPINFRIGHASMVTTIKHNLALICQLRKKGYTIRSLGKPQRTQAMSTLTPSKSLFFILQLHHHTILPVFAKLMTFGSGRELPHGNPNPDVPESLLFNSFNPTTSSWFGLASILNTLQWRYDIIWNLGLLFC